MICHSYEILPLPGWDDLYAVNDDQVISLRTGKPVKPFMCGRNTRPYLRVALYRLGCRKNIRLNRAVLSAKLGRELLPDMEADHIDNDSLNNHPDNLREVTRRENQQAKCDFMRVAGNTTTEFRGVYKVKNGFIAYAKIPGEVKVVRIGWFKYKQDALIARVMSEEFGIFTEAAEIELERIAKKADLLNANYRTADYDIFSNRTKIIGIEKSKRTLARITNFISSYEGSVRITQERVALALNLSEATVKHYWDSNLKNVVKKKNVELGLYRTKGYKPKTDEL